MPYEVLYDIRLTPYDLTGAFAGVALAMLIGFVLLSRKSVQEYVPWLHKPIIESRTFRALLVVFGVAWFLLATVSLYAQYSLRAEAAETKCTVVEGTVTDFRAEGGDGRASEQFQVDDVLFHYSRFERTGAFNGALPRKEPLLSAGKIVRICYTRRDGRALILRLEARRESGQS